jgi:uncharacterized protein YkwD
MMRIVRYGPANHSMRVLRCWGFFVAMMLSSTLAVLAQAPTSGSTATEPNTPDSFDVAAEKQLLEVLQADRQKAGVAPVEWNVNLRDTARLHAVELTKHDEMEAVFPDELDLIHRVALSNIGIAAAAEVMAKGPSVELAHAWWVANPATYSHALSPKYTDVGVAALKHDGRYYLVIDLVEALSKISVDELEAVVVKAIQDYRVQRKIAPLNLATTKRLRRVACDIARTGNLASQQIDPTVLEPGERVKNANIHIVNFTVTQPNDLPSPITRMTADPTITWFSVGACKAQSRYYVSAVFYYDKPLAAQ